MQKCGLKYVILSFGKPVPILDDTEKTNPDADQTFVEARLEKHPEKAFIGRTERGFDFLGYHFSPKGLSRTS
jgi:hypothetical protein